MAMPRPRARRRRPVAGSLPVARVALLTPVPHLDREFDYEVPEVLSDAAAPGVRVRVRLAGRLVDGVVLERVASSELTLQPIRSVHGPAVLTPQVAALCRAVADRYAGTFADVVRFAVPPRHARAEQAFPGVGAAPQPASATRPSADRAAWSRYRHGEQLLTDLAGGLPVRALWTSAPGERPADRIAELVVATSAAGRGAIVVVPDAADVSRVAAVLKEGMGAAPIRLVADAGPEARYRAFLKVLSGAARVVVGTRSAVFAPVVDLGLIVVWDDGDESLAEQQAPGWHAREVAALRSTAEDVSLVIGGAAVTLEAARMAASGWLVPVELPRPLVRARMPRIQVAADLTHGDPAGAAARIPAVALEVLRTGVEQGPVLVHVPRAGYLPGLACQSCREQVRCPQCSAPMRADAADRAPACATHGRVPDWRCPFCGGEQLRATVVGVRRTAEEFGRAMPGVNVITSSGQEPIRSLVDAMGLRTRCLVVATPGAEPDPGEQGYAALLLLDAAAALSRPGLRVAEDVLRRWLSAAALVRSAPDGGRVLVVGDPGIREVQALVRWDPRGYADRELDERRALSLAPAVRTALLIGPALEVGLVVTELAQELGPRLLRRSGPMPWTAGVSIRGSVPTARGGRRTRDGGHGGRDGRDAASFAGMVATDQDAPDATVAWLLAVSIADGPALTGALRRELAVRSARSAPVVTVRMDAVRTEPVRGLP